MYIQYIYVYTMCLFFSRHCLLPLPFRWSQAKPQGDSVSESFSVVVHQTTHNEGELRSEARVNHSSLITRIHSFDKVEH